MAIESAAMIKYCPTGWLGDDGEERHRER